MKARDYKPVARGDEIARGSPLPLSLAVIALNEEANIARCLGSVSGLVSEIVVIDSGSTDRTGEIARDFGARVIHNPWPGHVAQKNVALEHCTQPWVLSLDADEALDSELYAAIRAVLAEPGEIHGFEVNRLNSYLGAWIRHAWYPEWRLRLVRRDRGCWTGMDPHDHLTVDGPTRRLSGHLLHYSYPDLKTHLTTTVRYGEISGHQLAARGKRVGPLKIALAPLWRFWRSLLIKQAWRDGWRGWMIAFSSMFAGFAKYAFYLERTRYAPTDRDGEERRER